MLTGKKGLVLGVANEHSLAYGCARCFRAAGADLAITYLGPKTEPYVLPLAAGLGCEIARPCDVSIDGQLEAVFAEIEAKWGRLDFALHAIGFARAEDLGGRIVDCSADGFAFAMQVSTHSFLRMAKLAEPLMTSGGALLALSYYGAQKVIPHYGVMGLAKAALEAAVRGMSIELGGANIRVNALSPGPVATRSASGIAHFDDLLARTAARSPEHRGVTIEDVGELAAFLASDAAKAITGHIAFVDNGYHVLGG
jgi:enoyl-[acyl-carrier protein] reductase I